MQQNTINQKLNIIFLGGFPYPKGMAGTKRIQHAIDALKEHPNVALRVMILSQSSLENVLNGSHLGIKYQTIMSDMLGIKAALLLPILYLKASYALKRAFRKGHNNILYNYGPPNVFNAGVLFNAKHLGYKIVFDIVEDYDTAMNLSNSLHHKIKMQIIQYLTRHVNLLSAGIIVISSHLQKKYKELLDGKAPIFLHPITVDFSHFPSISNGSSKQVTLFYSGSFGQKDGLPVLLDAFDCVAARHANIRLVLTGKGNDTTMRNTLARIKGSPFKERIEYKGYLDDNDYYSALNDADIPCMTRIKSAYANAGFPFKLGEFLATGKPVIASRVSDVDKLLEDKRDAMLVKPGDSSEIAAGIEYLIARPQEAADIGLRGREKAKEFFDYHIQGQELLTFMKGI